MGKFYYRRPCILLIAHSVARWAWFDYSSSTKPAICLYTSDHKCNAGRGVDKMHQPFTRSYYEGYDLGRFRRVWDDHFCGEGMVMDITSKFYSLFSKNKISPYVSPLVNKRTK